MPQIVTVLLLLFSIVSQLSLMPFGIYFAEFMTDFSEDGSSVMTKEFTVVPVHKQNTLIFMEDFETYNFAEEGEKAEQFSLQKLGQTISSEVGACEGESAVRFHVDSRIEHVGHRVRSMLMKYPHPDNYGNLSQFGTFDTTAGEEFWYGFAIYVPHEWNTSALVWQQKAGLHYAIL